MSRVGRRPDLAKSSVLDRLLIIWAGSFNASSIGSIFTVEEKEALLPNTTLSHYRIVSKIGEGGMGKVYLAQDTKLDRKVALKILPAGLAANQDRMVRFVQE